jgi:hypothetical protein
MSVEGRRAERNGYPAGPSGYCETARRLLDEFGDAVRAVVMLHEHQFVAIVDGDSNAGRFDVLIHEANEKKHNAKYAYLSHLHLHGCSKDDGNIDTRRT